MNMGVCCFWVYDWDCIDERADTGGLEDTKRIYGITAVGEKAKPEKAVKVPFLSPSPSLPLYIFIVNKQVWFLFSGCTVWMKRKLHALKASNGGCVSRAFPSRRCLSLATDGDWLTLWLVHNVLGRFDRRCRLFLFLWWGSPPPPPPLSYFPPVGKLKKNYFRFSLVIYGARLLRFLSFFFNKQKIFLLGGIKRRMWPGRGRRGDPRCFQTSMRSELKACKFH